MNEARGGSRKAQNPPENTGQREPVEQEIVIRDVVREFLDTLQPKLRRSAVEKIESLKNPLNRRGSKNVAQRAAGYPAMRARRSRRQAASRKSSGARPSASMATPCH